MVKSSGRSYSKTTNANTRGVALLVSGSLAFLLTVFFRPLPSNEDAALLVRTQSEVDLGQQRSVVTTTTTTGGGGGEPTNNQNREGYGTTPIKVAYAVSLIECTDHHKSGHSSIAGLQDASIVMRHSIHQNSVRNPSSGSKYDYAMYAIVHTQAKACAPLLEDAGFFVLIRDPPVLEQDISDNYLRKNIHKEVCCGVHEFVSVYVNKKVFFKVPCFFREVSNTLACPSTGQAVCI